MRRRMSRKERIDDMNKKEIDIIERLYYETFEKKQETESVDLKILYQGQMEILDELEERLGIADCPR